MNGDKTTLRTLRREALTALIVIAVVMAAAFIVVEVLL
jgi:hypothetical protein